MRTSGGRGSGTGQGQGAELGASGCSGKTSRKPERLWGGGNQAKSVRGRGDLRSEGADHAKETRQELCRILSRGVTRRSPR